MISIIAVIPAGAKVRPGECRFERDMCDWSNGTDKSPASWRMATVNRRPSNLPDKTFGAPGSKIYFIVCCRSLISGSSGPYVGAVQPGYICL